MEKLEASTCFEGIRKELFVQRKIHKRRQEFKIKEAQNFPSKLLFPTQSLQCIAMFEHICGFNIGF